MAAQQESAPHKRSYGRGFFDGLRKAGIDNPEDFLNAAKLERHERELTGVMRKVFEAMPISEPWTPPQVASEMSRVTRSSPDIRAVTACLSALVERGLAKEPVRGTFIRVESKPRLAAVPPAPSAHSATPEKAATADAPAKPPEEESVEPMDRLASLASSMREIARRVSEMAQEAEEVAMDVEQRMDRIKADTAKLRQLQALLKDIGQ